MGKKILGVLLILALLVANIWFYYNYRSLKEEQKAQIEEIEFIASEKTELQIVYDNTVEELIELRTMVGDKDSSLVLLQTQIETQRSEIDRVLNKSKSSRNELAQARKLIDVLRGTTESYKQQIALLQEENFHLRDAVSASHVEKDELKTEIVTIKQDFSEKELSLLETNEQLEGEKTQLQEKVDRAKVLKATNVVAGGVMIKKNGKEKTTDNYKKTDKIKVCFDVLPNFVAEAGDKEMLLRLVSPEGSTLAVDAYGSGNFVVTESGEDQKYTSKAVIDYANKQERYCMYWEQEAPYQEGMYEVEVYHEGFLIGDSEFELRKRKLFY